MIVSQRDRLLKEWLEHGDIILAVDFDDTIYPFKNSTEEFCEEVISVVQRAQELGALIMIHTSSPYERYAEIQYYCAIKSINIASINSNAKEGLPYGQDGSKPYYNWQLCDRSALLEALDILENVMDVLDVLISVKIHSNILKDEQLGI